ncbi:MAG: hypothetical protein QXT73_08735 [Candidatus Methanomethylicaceae archaeon]
MTEREEQVVKFWSKQIELGKRYREQCLPEQKVKKWYEWYRGDVKGGGLNRIYSFGRSMIPRVYFRNPGIAVVPRKPEYAATAAIVEAVDNWLIDEIGLKGTLKRACIHAYLAGVGPIKLGYDSEFGFVPDLAVLPDSESPTQVHKDDVERRIEYRVGVKPGMPWAIDVHPLDIIVPWGATTFDNIPWIAHLVVRSLSDVKADAKYRNTEELKGGVKPDLMKYFPTMDLRVPEDHVLLVEIRDLKHQRVIVLCENRVLLDEEDVLQVEGLPYEFVVFNLDVERCWGIPDAKMIESEQEELVEIKEQIRKHRKLSLLKFLVQKGAMSRENIEKLLDEEGPTVLEVEAPPRTVLETLSAHVPPDLYRELMEIMADMRETIGFSRNQAGEFVAPVTPRTATEVMAVREAMEIRSDERRDILADVFTRIVRKLNQFIFKFWTTERVARVVGPEGKEYWVKFTGEELAGEYDFAVYPEQAYPISRVTRFQQALQLMQMFRGDPLIDQEGLRKLVLEQVVWADPRVRKLLVRPAPPGMVPGVPLPPVMGIEEAEKRGVKPTSLEELAGLFAE